MILKIFVDLTVFSCIQIKEMKNNTSDEIQDVKKEIEKSFRILLKTLILYELTYKRW